MSLSWIRNIALNEINTNRTLGIVFGRSHISAIAAVKSNKSKKIEWSESLKLDMPLFMTPPDKADIDNLRQFFEKIGTRLNNHFFRARVFLPDPLALYSFYAMDSVPGKAEQCRQLASWRLCKQLHLQENTLFCDYQILGEEGDKKLFMAMCMNAAWLKFIQNILCEYDILATVINTSISQHYNQLENTFQQESGALIDFSPDFWSVIAWDKKGQPRFIRSRWRDLQNENQDSDLQEITQEIIQSLIVHSQECRDNQIDNIYILGNEHKQGRLGAQFAKFMTKPVRYIDIPLDGLETKSYSALSALHTRIYAAVLSQ